MEETAKLLVPFLTFILGIWAVPFIESRKENAKAGAIRENFTIELQDELEKLDDTLRALSKVFHSLKDAEPASGKLARYVPSKLQFIFLKAAADSSFKKYTKKQRSAIKIIFIYVDTLDEYRNEIKNIDITKEEFAQQINKYKRYIFTATWLKNSIRIVLEDPRALYSNDSATVVDQLLEELQVKIKSSDLKTKTSFSINMAGRSQI